jgi:uncharacterized protein
MKPKELKVLRAYRLEQAYVALDEATLLLDDGRSTLGVVNRAYYAMFYAALALMQDISPLPSKHQGIMSLFDVIYVKTGIFDKRYSKSYHSAFELRQTSDYLIIDPVLAEKAKQVIDEARDMVEAIAAYLETLP